MKKTLLIPTIGAALCGLAGAPAAYAQDSEENFEGVKAGVQAGWERRKIDDTLLSTPNSARLNDKSSGFSYGGFVGYDAQFDKIVAGIEADFSPNGRTLRSTLTNGDSIELDSQWTASVSARAGIAVAPRLLAYGRVGYGINRYTVRRLAAGDNNAVATQKENGAGLIYGGGLEYAIHRNASFRVEYRRNENDGSLQSNQVLGGLTLRF